MCDIVLFYYKSDDTAAVVAEAASDWTDLESCFYIKHGEGLGSGALFKKLTKDCFGSLPDCFEAGLFKFI